MKKTLIERVEVGSGGAASIEFTSIPQDGTDLVLVISARSDYAGDIGFTRVRINSNDGSGIFLRGSGSAASSGTFSSAILAESNGNTATANTFGNTQVYISNYTSSSAKSISVDAVTENNATSTRQALNAATSTDTNAVTSILIEDVGDNLMQYSSASLYGITAGNDGTTTVS